MGGSGTGSGYPTRGGGGAEGDCDLQIQATLFGPVLAVVSGLNVGDILDIVLLPSGATSSVAVMTRSAPIQQAGTIAGVSQQAELVRCIQDGINYEAEVIQLAGPTVRLDIRMA
jgi:hypothetical protein